MKSLIFFRKEKKTKIKSLILISNYHISYNYYSIDRRIVITCINTTSNTAGLVI